MIRQIKLLTGVSLCNLFGVNEFRYTKDKKKKSNPIKLYLILKIIR